MVQDYLRYPSPSAFTSLAITMVDGADIGKFTLLAERVQQALATAIHKEPVRLKPCLVGVTPLNR